MGVPGHDRDLARRLLERRGLLALLVVALTGGLGFFAARVKPDHSIELLFPTFDKSRVDYDRYRKDFPLDDAHALVVLEAPDLFSPQGIARVAALEDDLGRIAGVLSTDGLTTTSDVVAEDEGIKMERIFPRPDLPPEEIAARRKTATSDPLFAWNLAPPDGSATTIRVTLTREHAAKEEHRTVFLRAARAVIARHEARAREAGAQQKLTLNGLPVIRSEFVELIQADLDRLFPITFGILLVLLYLAFRSVPEVIAAAVTIGASVVWTTGVMGIAGIPLQVLTQVTSIVVMIVSISDTVHIVTHYRNEVAAGQSVKDAIAASLRDNAMPCLLTEITIAGGFFSLLANEMVMIQQFGLATGAGMLLTWLANVTLLPLLLSFIRPGRAAARAEKRSAVAGQVSRFVDWVEAQVRTRPRTILFVWSALAVVALGIGLRVGKEYYSYDDLRPEGQLYRNLRYVERVHGGTVPLAIFVEPPGAAQGRKADAMLEPEALALLDRISRKLETGYPDLVKNTSSLAKYLAKAHRLLAGEEMARESPLPRTRALAAQELLAIDDPKALRDLLAFDRGTAAVTADLPDLGSSRATQVIAELRRYFDEEERRTGYRITLTGIYGIADGIYRSLVGGLLASLGIAVLVSFAIFALVLRSFGLALIALVPNLLPLVLTLGIMSVLGIDLKPTTVIIFSITLVIADDDTIQFMTRFRRRLRAGQGLGHGEAAMDTLRETGLPMLLTTGAVTLGFLALTQSRFLGLSNLGLLIGVSLLTAVFADLFLSPLLLGKLRPRI